jgi:MOSC domain-containing protein YiiM
MPSLVAVCVVHDLRKDAGYFGVTAIDKRPATGKVKVTKYGLRGDVQADRKHHGGIDKALYVYGQDDADYWSQQLGRELPAGWFGENLRIDGLDVNAARIGEVWRIGDTVTVEVTMPRSPCQTFARWVGGEHEKGWVKRFAAERRLGPYLKVLKTGTIAAGDAVTVLSTPEHAPTVAEVFRED